MVEVFKTWHKILDSRDFWKEEIVLDGELLPWSALGRELIDKEFFQYGKSIERELNLLASDEVFKSFGTDLDVAAHKKEMDTFLHQLELYGQDCPIHYHPFSVLAVDGVSWLGENQHSLFSQLLPNEPHLVVDLGSDNAVEIAEMFFTSLTESGSFHEGIVIKPLVYKTGVAPYMKVRNENYLHLIYGYDYRFNYQKMVENKRIGKKLELSIKEFELGGQMLNAKSKRDLLELACKMKFQMNAENELDPRL